MVSEGENRQAKSCWIFGYGSLIWRPDFPFIRREEGWVPGWARRFWQASPDHRGTPDSPGRVVTLIPAPGERCWGVAYEVSEEDKEDVLRNLDIREQAGYDRVFEPVHLRSGDPAVADALMYVAREDNPCFVGPCDRDALIRCIRSAEGPSGSNRAYVQTLATSLRKMGAEDLEVFELADAIL